MSKRFGFMAVVFLAAIFMLLSGCDAIAGIGSPPTPTVESGLLVVDGIVSAEAEVVPVRYVDLGFPDGGVIEDIMIAEGDMVEAGQVVARLEGTERLGALITGAELALLTAQQSIDMLYDDALVRQASQELAAIQTELVYDDLKEDREDMAYIRGGTDAIDLAYANYVIAQHLVDELEREFAGVINKPEDDEDRADVLSRLTTARENRNAALAVWNYLKATPDNLDVAEADGQLEIAEADLVEARRQLSELENGVDTDDLAVAEAGLLNAQAQLEAARTSLADLELRSPIAGVVVSKAAEVGEITAPGAMIVTIMEGGEWRVETTDLTELDVIDIHPGDPVTVAFEALPGLEISGQIERIKELGYNKQGDITYTAVIKTDQWDERLRWKMTAYVTFRS